LENVFNGFYTKPDIDVDTLDVPHIAYYGATGLEYRNRNGGSWSAATTVDGAATAGGAFYKNISIVLDDSDNIHIAYTTGSGDVKYAFYNGVWTLDTVATLTNSDSESLSMSLDSEGIVHMVYQDDVDITYTFGTLGSWDTSVIYTIDVGSYSSDVAVDVRDYLSHVAYLDNSWNDLRYSLCSRSGFLLLGEGTSISDMKVTNTVPNTVSIVLDQASSIFVKNNVFGETEASAVYFNRGSSTILFSDNIVDTTDVEIV
jgi:hypothetical protein